MILDKRTEFADAASVAAAAGTSLIGSQIATDSVDIGNGQPIYLIITTETEIITGGAAGTLVLSLVSDATAAIATDGTATIHWQSQDFVTDDAAANDSQLNAGGVLAVVALPAEGATYEAYLGIIATVGTTTITAGTINAFLSLDPTGWKAFPEGAN